MRVDQRIRTVAGMLAGLTGTSLPVAPVSSLALEEFSQRPANTISLSLEEEDLATELSSAQKSCSGSYLSDFSVASYEGEESAAVSKWGDSETPSQGEDGGSTTGRSGSETTSAGGGRTEERGSGTEPSEGDEAQEKEAQQIAQLVEKQRAFAYQNTHEVTSELDQLVVNQMKIIGSTAGIPIEELENARVANYNTFVSAVTDNWVYTVDVCCNQTLRPVCNLAPLVDQLKEQVDPDNLVVDSEGMTWHARGVAAALGCDGNLLSEVTLKKEIFVLNRCGEIAPKFYKGRNNIRLRSSDNFWSFQILYSANYDTVRVETNCQTEGVIEIRDLLISNLDSSSKNMIPASDVPGDCFTLGNFFSIGEHRFECDAYSLEGEEFLTVSSLLAPIPYDGNDYDDSNYNFVEVEEFRKSGRYKYNAAFQWRNSGGVGSIRGNWNSETQSWDRPGVRILHCALEGYPLVGEPPTETKQLTLSDGITREFPYSVSRVMDEQFRKDLEKCQVVSIFTHMGPIENALQMSTGIDIWSRIGDANHPFGSGDTRHLLLYGCATMGGPEEGKFGPFMTLFHEWLPGRYVDGLRTVCGNDGETIGGPNNGWLFFRRYNKGESISESHCLASFDSWNGMNPVTVAYGKDIFGALSTATDERFSEERAVANFAVGIVWTDDDFRDKPYVMK